MRPFAPCERQAALSPLVWAVEQAHETVEDGTVEDGINTLELRCVMVCVFFLTKDSCFYFQVKKSFADI